MYGSQVKFSQEVVSSDMVRGQCKSKSYPYHRKQIGWAKDGREQNMLTFLPFGSAINMGLIIELFA